MKHIRAIYGVVIASVIAPLYAFAQFGFGGGFQPPMFGAGVNQYTTGGQFGGGNQYGGSYYGQTRGLQVTNFSSVLGIINTLLGYMQVGIFLVALFYFLWGAYLMVTGDVSGGAKKMGYAAVGIGAAILAFSIIPFVCFVVGSQGPACRL